MEINNSSESKSLPSSGMVGSEEGDKVSEGALIIGSVLGAMGCVLSITFLAFNIRYRNVRIIKMSSPNMNTLVSMGSLMAYSCCVLYGLDALSSHNSHMATLLCQVRAWLLPLSVTLIYGPLFAKSWRVRKIFHTASVKRVVIRDNKLLSMVCGLLLVDAVILGLWQGLDPLHNRLLKETIEIKSSGDNAGEVNTLYIQQCHSRYAPIWISAVYTYKTFLLLYGAYISWAIRAVSLPSMNESRCILTSALLTVITGSAVAAITVWLHHVTDAVHACAITAVWLCTTVTLCFLYIPKMILWYRNNDDDIMKLSMTSQIMYSPDQSAEQVEEEIYHLVAENRSLKKSLSEKEVTIRSLQDHVSSAREKLKQIVSEENKHDSGLDNDFSSSSLQDDDSPNRIHNTLTLKRSNSLGSEDIRRQFRNSLRSSSRSYKSSIYRRLSFLKKSHDFESSHTRDVLNVRDYPRNRQRSRESWTDRYVRQQNMMTSGRLRDSLCEIAHDLDTADNISAVLTGTITNDLHSCRNYVVCGSRHHVNQDIAGSIVRSLDLEDNSDTYSFLSAHLSNVGGVENDGYHSELDHSLSIRCSSSESVSTLGNDRYYPPNENDYHKKKKKRRARWKREPKPKIYIVQMPQDPRSLATSGVAVTRSLNSQGTIV